MGPSCPGIRLKCCCCGCHGSRSLGDLDFKEPQRFVECEPDVTRLLLLPKRDTFVVLGSDGLWDVLSDTDAVITAATALKVRNFCYFKFLLSSIKFLLSSILPVPGFSGLLFSSSIQCGCCYRILWMWFSIWMLWLAQQQQQHSRLVLK